MLKNIKMSLKEGILKKLMHFVHFLLVKIWLFYKNVLYSQHITSFVNNKA